MEHNSQLIPCCSTNVKLSFLCYLSVYRFVHILCMQITNILYLNRCTHRFANTCTILKEQCNSYSIGQYAKICFFPLEPLCYDLWYCFLLYPSKWSDWNPLTSSCAQKWFHKFIYEYFFKILTFLRIAMLSNY